VNDEFSPPEDMEEAPDNVTSLPVAEARTEKRHNPTEQEWETFNRLIEISGISPFNPDYLGKCPSCGNQSLDVLMHPQKGLTITCESERRCSPKKILAKLDILAAEDAELEKFEIFNINGSSIPSWQPLPGITHAGAVSIWHGPPKGGKSLLVCSAIASLLSNDTEGRIMGLPVTRKPSGNGEYNEVEHRIMYLCLEDPRNEFTGRMQAITSLFSLDESIYSRLTVVYSQPGSMERMFRIVRDFREQGYTFLFIDNLQKIAPDAETGTVESSELMNQLETVASELNASVVLIHHDRKMPGQDGGKNRGDEMLRGSSSLIGRARALAQIRKNQDDDIQLDGGGVNYAAQAGSRIYKICTEKTRSGYEFAVAVPDDRTNSPFKDFTAEQCRDAIDAIADEAPENLRESIQSEQWAGIVVARALDIDVGTKKKSLNSEAQKSNRMKVQSMLQTWTRNRLLRIVGIEMKMNYNRSTRKVDVYQTVNQP